ncbi:preprotein translocase subunit YajC [Brachybacterium sp. DNPG3]
MDLLPLLLIFAVMMLPLLFMSNRQKKAQRAHQDLVKSLGIGDEVRTHSGFYGLIVEEFDDVVILESESGAQTKWARQAIAGKAEPLVPEVEESAADESGSASSDFADGEVPGVTSRDDDSGRR